ILPSPEDTFFTTPSSAVAQAGASVVFGLSRTPARLVGFVRDDAGRPMGAVALRLESDSRKASATTDSAGRFVVATAAGDYVAAIDAESLPAGYDASSVRPTRVHLRRGEAARLELVVTAHRAFSGRVRGDGALGAHVRLVELGRTVAVESDGGYAFRNLKPGGYTVAASFNGRTVLRRVLIPEGPALLYDVDLDLTQSLDGRVSSVSRNN
ncbi:MAG TPA: carboxypeptidase-like regulatory domain-containing protein, partial [Vicinamibacteria bacterium]